MRIKIVQDLINLARGKEIEHIEKPLKIVPTHLSERFIYKDEVANKIILEQLQKETPCMITRFGSNELEAAAFFYKRMNKMQVNFSKRIKHSMKYQAGFFSPTDEDLTRYGCETIEMLPNIDILAAWNCALFKSRYIDEKAFTVKYAKNATLINISALGDCIGFYDEPWTQYLEGKNVLVIHPFEKTIQHQYSRRKHLFANEKHLPEFNLKTLKAVQGIGDKDICGQYASWFNALEYMYEQIEKTDFDVAIIGAGAYGMFLANHVKKIGKQAIHIGGAAQILFGIKGERWDESLKDLYNDYWIRPLDEDIPKDLTIFAKNEGRKAYW